MSDDGVFLEVDRDEAWELLRTTTVGRVAFVVDGRQELLPVNFVVHRDAVYVRTAPDSVLARLAEGHDAVAFEVDHHDDTFRLGWSVVLHARSGRVTDEQLLAELAERGRPAPWAAGDRDLVLELRSQAISGRRVRQG
ncbi:MAG: pyridoxamine 5'-phosphate oxidase family protein [Aeromicrobium erythreum]